MSRTDASLSPRLATSTMAAALPARFLGVAGAVPDTTVTNHDLEAHLDTTDAWIVDRTGIRERRVSGDRDSTPSLAVTAGRRALARSGLPASAVDLVILATTTPDQSCPATAATVQDELGTAGAAFDLNAACAGFVYALHTAAAALVTPGLDHVLVIGADRFTSLIDPEDRATAILFGDGAGAVVLGRSDAGAPGPGVLGVDLGGDGSGARDLEVPVGERFVRMDGRQIFRQATRGLVESGRSALERAGANAADVDLFVPHQANRRIMDAAASRLGIPSDRMVVNLDRYGNTSAGSVPLALADAADTGRLTPGTVVLTSGIGAGMAWATLLLRWGS
ncbi:MAG: beta-ketoacyl-ACP synthase III [Acidimicrobiales bacterium]